MDKFKRLCHSSQQLNPIEACCHGLLIIYICACALVMLVLCLRNIEVASNYFL